MGGAPTGLGLRLRGLAVLLRSGVLVVQGPVRLTRRLRRLAQYGPTPAGAYAAAAASAPDQVALVDERASRTYADVDRRVRGLAAGLAALGADETTPVGLLAHNSVDFVESLVAVSRLGADALLLSTFLSPVQAGEVLKHESPGLVVADPELVHLLADRPPGLQVVLTRRPDADARHLGLPTLDDLASRPAPQPAPPRRRGRIVVLTSGTTGTPKGARRPAPRSLAPAAAMLSRLPLRRFDRILIAPPLFHAWGLGILQLAPALCATVVLRRRPDPETLLAAVSRERCTALVGVPVIFDRVVALEPAVRGRYNLSSLRVVATSGSALTPQASRRMLDFFGDTVHNFYGSTENSWATIASPQDLREAPGTAGRPPLGTALLVLDEAGDPVAPGTVGSVYVGNHLEFEGYTDGTDRPRAHGLLATGDRGYLDAAGRLMVVGRDDDLVISGAEKVYPLEVEDAIERLPGVLEVAVVGRPDPEMGQRLVAFVVPSGTAELTPERVREHVRENLARYAVPREVRFVEELPRTPTGKVLKRLLPQ